MTARRHTPAQIMRAYAVAAELVEVHGSIYLPYFEFMEKLVAELEAEQDALARARRVSRELRHLSDTSRMNVQLAVSNGSRP